MRRQLLYLFLAAIIFTSTAFGQAPAAGSLINNQATATYSDPTGQTLTTQSAVVTITIAAVAGVQVTPDETTISITYGPLEDHERTFQICNNGNLNNDFKVTAVNLGAPATLRGIYYDTNGNGMYDSGDTTVTLNNTLTPVLAPGTCTTLLVLFNTGAASPGSTYSINVTAQTNTPGVNGQQSDSGQRLHGMSQGPNLSDPRNPALPPVKTSSKTPLADPLTGKTSEVLSQGEEFNYYVTFKNAGEANALNVLFRDDLPTGISYVANSLKVNGASFTDAVDGDNGFVTGQHIEVKWASVAIGAIITVEFKARMDSTTPGRGLVNIGNFTASNIPNTVPTNPHVAILNPVGIVYAGRAGGSSPIGGAKVILATDPNGASPLNIPANTGYTPNQPNNATFTTSGDGGFNFTPGAGQVGDATTPARYYIISKANNFTTRVVEVTVTPAGNGLFNVLLHASDGLPLAVEGGFTLTNGDVILSELAILTFNLPMFEEQTLEIRKTNDRQYAQVGDIVSYNVAVTNKTSATISSTTIFDKLPGGFRLGENLVQIQRGNSITTIPATANGGILSFVVGNLNAHETVIAQYRLVVGPDAQMGQVTNTAQATGVFPTGEIAKSPEAKANVLVTGGVFTDRQAILGRVFEDLNMNGYFDKDSDRPVAGARLYTSSGQAVITDENGQYNFPILNAGSVVISLDPKSLPKGAYLHDENLKSHNSWTRLVQHPLLAGGIMRQNFPLTPSPNWQAKEPETADIKRRPCENMKDFDCRMKKLRAAASAKLHKEADDEAGREIEPKVIIKEAAAQTDRINPDQIIIPAYKTGDVVMDRALSLEVRVAQGHTVRVEVEGQVADDNQIGQKKTDPKVGYSSYIYNSLSLKPGPNTVRITSIAPDKKETSSQMISLYGRGPIHSINFHPDRNTMIAGGRDVLEVAVEFLDEWGHPASDNDQIAVKASAGRILQINQTYDPNAFLMAKDLTRSNGATVEQETEIANSLILSTTDGIGLFKFISPPQAGLVRFDLTNGKLSSRFDLNVNPEVRPTILVGIGKVSIGAAAPDHQLSQDNQKTTGHGQLFVKTNIGEKTSFTGAYDTSRPLNRVQGQPFAFESNPQDRLYPVFGDSSTRYNEAQSNSKLYFKLEHGQQYAMFGDYQLMGNEIGNFNGNQIPTPFGGAFGPTINTRQQILSGTGSVGPQLSTYNRVLTGGKLHLESSKATYLTLAGARPSSSYARDVFRAGILGYTRLSFGNILANTEQIFIEIRDRRNPEVVVKTEALTRGVDYQLDYLTGVIFLQRQIQQFDSALNLVQIVALYEYNDGGRSSNVYAGRAGYEWKKAGLQFGGTYINQAQAGFSPFKISGIDIEKSLPRSGRLTLEWSRTSGELAGAGNFFGSVSGFHRGNAYRAELNQPLTSKLRVQGLFMKSEEGYLNPFGGTITPGSRRMQASLIGDLTAKDQVSLTVIDEKNKTVNVDNGRQTLEANWQHQFNDKLKAGLGYSYRHLTMNSTSGSTSTPSQMATASLEWKPIEKLSLSVQREQNLTHSTDQTYPNQWVASGKYDINNFTNIFFTSRRGTGAIIPIADLSSSGFTTSNSNSEIALGVETKVFRNTSLTSRYQIQNSFNGTDSFAVFGLGQRIPINKVFSLDATLERGFQIAGPNGSFTSGSIGATFVPTEDFKSSLRYELRDRQGFGQILSAGAAGRLGNFTALGQFQLSDTSFQTQANIPSMKNKILFGRAAFAWRPAENDNSALLFSYNTQSFDRGRYPGDSSRGLSFSLNKETAHDFSSDGYYRLYEKLEFFGRAAYRHVNSSGPSLNSLSTDTYLFQGRLQDRFARYFDAALETRYLGQVGTSGRMAYGIELGVWAIQDLRFGIGYNASDLSARYGYTGPTRRGAYFTITTKLSNLFNLFGTSPDQLQKR